MCVLPELGSGTQQEIHVSCTSEYYGLSRTTDTSVYICRPNRMNDKKTSSQLSSPFPPTPRGLALEGLERGRLELLSRDREAGLEGPPTLIFRDRELQSQISMLTSRG